MTNEQKYKTPDERIKAFDDFCKGQGDRCNHCEIARKRLSISRRSECVVYWLALEAEEEERKPVRKCDKYRTAGEAHVAFAEFCGKNECRICRFGDSTKTAGCVLEWLYEEAGKEEK